MEVISYSKQRVRLYTIEAITSDGVVRGRASGRKQRGVKGSFASICIPATE